MTKYEQDEQGNLYGHCDHHNISWNGDAVGCPECIAEDATDTEQTEECVRMPVLPAPCCRKKYDTGTCKHDKKRIARSDVLDFIQNEAMIYANAVIESKTETEKQYARARFRRNVSNVIDSEGQPYLL